MRSCVCICVCVCTYSTCVRARECVCACARVRVCARSLCMRARACVCAKPIIMCVRMRACVRARVRACVHACVRAPAPAAGCRYLTRASFAPRVSGSSSSSSSWGDLHVEGRLQRAGAGTCEVRPIVDKVPATPPRRHTNLHSINHAVSSLRRD